jgi:hypothetical protein
MNKLIFKEYHFPHESDILYFINIYLYSELKSEFRIDILRNLIN